VLPTREASHPIGLLSLHEAKRPENRRGPGRQIGIQPERGCHRDVTRLYPPLARKRDRDHKAGTTRLLLSSVGFVSFRAPIDSVTDPGGQPRRPADPFLSLRRGLAPVEEVENEVVDFGATLQ
jgi:hypothetical protein